MGYVEDLRVMIGHRPVIFTGAVTVIADDKGRLLLQERKFPKGTWGLPGGLMELGESTEQAARREVLEETGLTVSGLHLINVYSGPDHFVVAENGDEFYLVTIAYYSEGYEGELVIEESESVSFEFFFPDQLPEKMIGSHRVIVKEFLDKHYSVEEHKK
ncbi:NUDIX hydrolase [Planococcus shenhongbingii]|uniref:NUDIX hydrolase n=1 Tax=Planococcus shenhongbingii TaxID=3058398 RepID=A0ABT8NFF4_9BACL|nr:MULTISPECIES: NUDIX hydrolase [unclassified Planococcus (in: firmicutes)]MDN7246439.1 NUDIX hydrolase [Planococcus sp. N017]WKA59431.1 NUDIX hydrolase [Planococcus sp. N016]